MKYNKGRRSFLNWLLGTSLLFAGGLSLYPILRYLWPSDKVMGAGGSTIVTIPLEDLPIGEVKFIRYKNRPALVINEAKTGIYALSAVCTHQECIVKWDEDRGELICPCHGAIFDMFGHVKKSPATRDLDPIIVNILNDQIIVGGI
ncbi:MAG: Rieske 2Fe-2S domain-containing protein [Nitrospinae bacterium]|nr:Rieske 2Fe-2S domain-containing protein [Nitrospinota bacterium]